MGRKYTDAQKKAILKYQDDKVQILVTPDQREHYRKLAESRGMNLTKLIISLLEKERQG